MVARVNGGIITDQMLKGKFRYYKMTSGSPVFLYTTGTASGVIVPDQEVNGDGDPYIQYQYKIYTGYPVPESAANQAFRVISTKCTISQINLVSSSAIHFAVENTSNGWDTTAEGSDLTSDADDNMTIAVRALGATLLVWDESVDGYTVDMTTVTITEVDFQLV